MTLYELSQPNHAPGTTIHIQVGDYHQPWTAYSAPDAPLYSMRPLATLWVVYSILNTPPYNMRPPTIQQAGYYRLNTSLYSIRSSTTPSNCLPNTKEPAPQVAQIQLQVIKASKRYLTIQDPHDRIPGTIHSKPPFSRVCGIRQQQPTNVYHQLLKDLLVIFLFTIGSKGS